MPTVGQRDGDLISPFAYASQREREVRRVVDALRNLTLTPNEATHLKAMIDARIRR